MWKEIVKDILDSGITREEIRKATGLAKSSLSELESGITKTGPRADRVLALHALHRKAKRRSARNRTEGA